MSPFIAMSPFADIALHPGGLIAWLVVGLIAGWLAGVVMKGSGYGIVVDMILGLVGAVLGGLLLGMLVTEDFGLLGSIVVAFVGACVLIILVRFVAPGRSRV
jgi:uncharacterized membrane protein YeaQ/YmgE (transglycosylase-associated protein family)